MDAAIAARVLFVVMVLFRLEKTAIMALELTTAHAQVVVLYQKWKLVTILTLTILMI